MKERIIGVVMIVVVLIGFASYSGTFAWLSTTAEDEAVEADMSIGRLFSIEGELGSRYSMGDKKIMVPGENLIVRPSTKSSATETITETTAAGGPGSETTTALTLDNYEPCKLSIKSGSTIETQLRVKIEYSYLEYDGHDAVAVGADNLCVYRNNNPQDPNGRLKVGFTDSNKWVYDSNDGFWYYNPTEVEEGTTGYLIIPPTYEEEVVTVTTTETETETEAEGGEPETPTTAAETTTAEPTTKAPIPDANIDLIDYIYYDPAYYADANQFDYNTVWAGKEVRVRLTVQAKQARYVDWGTLAQQIADFGA